MPEPIESNVNYVTGDTKEFTQVDYESTAYTDIIVDILGRIETAMGGQPAPIPNVRITFKVEII